MVCSQVTQSAKIHDYMRVCKLIIDENFFLDKVHVVRRSSGFNFSHVAYVINEYVIVTSLSFIRIEKYTLLK